MLNNIYLMVHQQNSQALAENLTLIEENLHNSNMRNNIVHEMNLNEIVILEPKKDPW